ncbi:MAG: hypothetical protein HON47_02000 [Candidatus Diapherotrites archaeon]|jgi:hypothetical protein|uniref:Uncharacterized protein n=1 Tax=Candidatus Iainarchaeum sp. TaxID=3101447 RepID=A0A8T5GED2_9ARCH|nr:hypothetical protein [Candidatus Diapherotrites archaeon]MBT7241493.1 hypothetical protein [Candidatus Diapherotrites archaeon]
MIQKRKNPQARSEFTKLHKTLSRMHSLSYVERRIKEIMKKTSCRRSTALAALSRELRTSKK